MATGGALDEVELNDLLGESSKFDIERPTRLGDSRVL